MQVEIWKSLQERGLKLDTKVYSQSAPVVKPRNTLEPAALIDIPAKVALRGLFHSNVAQTSGMR